jgi:nitrilase
MSKAMQVSCIQMCSTDDVEHNLTQTDKYLKEAAQKGSKLVLLPETFSFMAKNHQEKLKNAEKSHLILQFLSEKAKKYHIWIIAGSTLFPAKHHDKLYNRCPIFAPDGSQHTHYDKMHLFDADLDTESWQESATIEAGKEPVAVNINDDWKAGISICYDLRFPELYRHYSSQGCNILTVAAAFTVPTGKAHWETLLRARAIENQCYILAAAQSGTHNDGRKTYGHSMIIDPWGKIIAKLSNGEGIITAKLDLAHLQHIRASLPVLQHKP